MNPKKFSEAMSELDNKYIDEALNYKKKAKKPVWVKWGAVAACLCFAAAAVAVPALLKPQESANIGGDGKSPSSNVMTELGFLALTAYAASPDGGTATELPRKEIIMQEGMEISINSDWNPAMSSRPGIPFKFFVSEYPDAAFELSIDGGSLLLWEDGKITPVQTPFNAENGTTLYWSGFSQSAKGDDELYKNAKAYMDVIILEKENIVGYAVVEILHANDSAAGTYYAKLLKSVSFPRVNGRYQKITGDYVKTEIEQVKNENADDEEITAAAVMSSGTISDTGEMKGRPLMFCLSGKDIKTVRFSCKNYQINFTDWTEKREEYGYAQNFTVPYGEDEKDYRCLTIDWAPNAVIRRLTDNGEAAIAALPPEMRRDIIVMEITFANGKTATKAITITLLEDGRFFASFDDYKITEEDSFVKRADENDKKTAADKSELAAARDKQAAKPNEEKTGKAADNSSLETAKKAARNYYARTVFKVVSIKLKSRTQKEIAFSVCVSKGGAVQEPNRTIILQLVNGNWEVTGEGY